MSPDDRFATSVALIRSFEEKEFRSNYELEGVIVLDRGVIKNLVLLDENGSVDQVEVGGEVIAGLFSSKLPPHVNMRATVRVRLNSLGRVYRSFDLFLDNHDHRTVKPDAFYVIEEDIDSRDEMPSSLLEGYNDVVSFIDMLAQLSDVPNRIRSKSEIFFSGATRREIPPKYTRDDIRTLPDLKTLRQNLLTELHHEEKRGIFKTILLDLMSDESDENSIFVTLLQRYEVLKKKYLEAYNVYIQQFSAKEIIQEVEEKNIELASKLHAVIVEMNKSMFALPIAFIFAATRLDSQPLFSLNNTIILFCSWVAVGLFFISLSSHKRTLDFVCGEIQSQKDCASKYKDLKDRLIPPYENLISRCTFQQGLRIYVGISLWVVLLSLTGVYIYYGITIPDSQLKSLSYINTNVLGGEGYKEVNPLLPSQDAPRRGLLLRANRNPVKAVQGE